MMNIICFGDSNTYGYDSADFFEGCFPEKKRWPSILAELTGADIVNLGLNGREVPYPGKDTEICLTQIAKHLPADIIIIMLGTNDILHGVSAVDTADRLTEFVHRISIPEILLLPPLHINTYGQCIFAETEKLRALISCIPDVHFADTSEWDIDLQYDGIHISENSQEEFAHMILRTLQRNSII